MAQATARVVDSDSNTSSASSSSGHRELFEFTRGDRTCVRAFNFVGGPGGTAVGQTTTIFFDTRLSYRRCDEPKPDLRSAPMVYGSWGSLAIIPLFLSGLALVVGLITAFSRPRPGQARQKR